MYEAAFQLQMIDDQTSAFHMKDLHACARLVDEDERVSVLHVETHLVCDDAAQRVEALAHVRRMRIQEETLRFGAPFPCGSWPASNRKGLQFFQSTPFFTPFDGI